MLKEGSGFRVYAVAFFSPIAGESVCFLGTFGEPRVRVLSRSTPGTTAPATASFDSLASHQVIPFLGGVVT